MEKKYVPFLSLNDLLIFIIKEKVRKLRKNGNYRKCWKNIQKFNSMIFWYIWFEYERKWYLEECLK